MSNDIIGLATVVSAICAVIGVPSAILSLVMFFKSRNIKKDTEDIKKDTENIKKEIEEYNKGLLAKNDLVILASKKDHIKRSFEKFNKISCKDTDLKDDVKIEKDYYRAIKTDIENVLYDIPNDYEEIIKKLKEIKKALIYCIREDITLDNVSSDLEYNYGYIESKFEEVISEISKITRDITFSY